MLKSWQLSNYMPCRGLSWLDIRPLDPPFDNADRAVVNPVMSRQLLIDPMPTSLDGPLDKTHLPCVEDRHSMTLPFHSWRWRMSAMPHRVPKVFALAAAIEVVRVAATSVATTVVDLFRGFIPIEQSKGSAVRGALSIAAQAIAAPLPVAVVANASPPFPALVWQANPHLANKVFPRACGQYDVLHQPASIRLVTPQGLQSAGAPQSYRWA